MPIQSETRLLAKQGIEAVRRCLLRTATDVRHSCMQIRLYWLLRYAYKGLILLMTWTESIALGLPRLLSTIREENCLPTMKNRSKECNPRRGTRWTGRYATYQNTSVLRIKQHPSRISDAEGWVHNERARPEK